MTTFALLLSVAALVLALTALSRGGSGDGAEEIRREARRAASLVEDDLRDEIARTRRLLAQVAAGETLERDEILDGQLWRDVDAREAERLVAQGDVLVVDVRTPGETAAGIVAGAVRIPMDELEERKDELPRDRPVLLYCAVGGRSAAACEALAGEGWDRLLNLTGGFSEWSGPVDRPA